MKHTSKILSAAVALAGFAAMSGCAGGGYAEVDSGPGYYGDGPWIDNTVVVDGGRGWYGGHHDNAYVHPYNHPAPHAQAHAAVHVESHSAPAPHGGGGDHHR
ncbi:MAG TPA: hypothetical protein VFE25_03665 [Opitutaceae bacterium]|jgi:hypothetical protein|nr:hypothetical protein [Opitutaceae bacterium]